MLTCPLAGHLRRISCLVALAHSSLALASDVLVLHSVDRWPDTFTDTAVMDSLAATGLFGTLDEFD